MKQKYVSHLNTINITLGDVHFKGNISKESYKTRISNKKTLKSIDFTLIVSKYSICNVLLNNKKRAALGKATQEKFNKCKFILN